MEISLTGQRAFVTAGGAGIGKQTVLALRAAGADVVTCDLDESALAALPADVATAVCDVSDSAALDAIFDSVLPDGLDILVNNAGIAGPTKAVEDITDDEWRATMSVGIDAMFYCVRRVAPILKRRGRGSIVNITSTAGIFGFPNRTPYAAAKWAVVGLTKTLAMELGPQNIRVNAIAPGSVNGERIDRVIAAHAETDSIEPDEVRRMYAVATSMQSFVDPEEIADLIVFLTSDFGRHISGQVIGVDGHTETLHPRTV